MQPDEMAVFFTLVGAFLFLMLLLTNAYKRRLEFKLRKMELEAHAKASPPPPAGRDDRTDLLEDRVRVLERIATDRGQDIAHQIEKLRDWPAEEKA
jgi:hypothetical protein